MNELLKAADWLKPTCYYEPIGQQIWFTTKNNGDQLLIDLRGWGAIQNLFSEGGKWPEGWEIEAGKFQDEIGQFIADAINEKLTKKDRDKIFREELEKRLPSDEEIYKEELGRMEMEGPSDFSFTGGVEWLIKHLNNDG